MLVLQLGYTVCVLDILQSVRPDFLVLSMTFISIFSIIQSWRSMPATWEYQYAILCIIRQEINSSMVSYSFCAYITTGQSGRSSEHRTQNNPDPTVYEIVSLHIRSMWETICDAQAGFCTHSSNGKFLSKFSEKPLSGISDQNPSPIPFWKTSDLRWPKFTLKYPPPILENFRFEMTKVYSKIPPPPLILENFRFEMTKVYSEIPPPPFRKLQIWDDQTLLWNTPPPFQKTSDLRWPKFTPEYTSPHSLAIREIVCGD